MASKNINAIIKNPVTIKIGDYKTELRSGSSVIDVKFPNVLKTEVGEIHFKNYYTAFLTIKAKEKTSNNIDADSSWKTVVDKLQLMPDAHCETGAQDYFHIKQKQFLFDMNNTIGLRFILQQPSPVWKEFKIEDIKIYRTSLQNESDIELPAWILKSLDLGDGDCKTDDKLKETHKKMESIEGLASVDIISQGLQKLWVLAEQSGMSQTSSSLGRYDVDGSYEINLLSYT
ncbi:nicolin-1-like [Tubulanus polymorphus]|uniref:nicolin-1-like n=1 Tax=Tubulanus polymorphus TaxID=672921 RepID=UPI003DA5F3B7